VAHEEPRTETGRRRAGPEVERLAASDARRVPWRNGRGVTRELAVWPRAARFERLDFDWRVSTAPVDEPGPFSTLPGLERILVVTEGAGCELVHGDAAPRARVRRLQPYRFSGEWPTAAELPHGPVTDFNVIFVPERVRASVEALALGTRRVRESLRAGQLFVHVLAAPCRARVTGEEEPLVLAPGDSLWVRALRGGEELELAGTERGAEALLVALEDVPA
jgi:environmental stress-induced protein Ves